MLVIVALLAAAVIGAMFFLNKRPANSPPIVKVGIPFIGNFVEFAKNPVDFMKLGLDAFGPIYTMQILHKNLTFLFGPEASTPFFKLGDDRMSQSDVYQFMTPVFGEGIVYDAEPKKRLQQMQAMSQGLRSGRLRAYVPKIESETIAYFKQHWKKNGGRVNLLETLSELTILTSSRCLHGDDVRENLFAEVSQTYHDLDKGVTALSFFFPYAPTAAHAKRDAARKAMVDIFSKVIRERRESGRKADENTNTDILQIYIDFEYKEGGKLTDEQIVGLLIALLFAGQHTSSISSTWTAFFLMHNPELLEKFMAEQQEVLEKHAGDAAKKNLSSVPLDFDMVGDMNFSNNSVREALRLCPPLIMLMRMALVDIETQVGDKTYVIPKGDIVVTSPQVSSRMESVFKNADKFDPDRFAEPRLEDKAHPYAYLGFGSGRHACLGQQFGLLQVKTILSVLFRNFRLKPVDKEFPECDYAAMVVGPKNHTEVEYELLPGSTLFD